MRAGVNELVHGALYDWLAGCAREALDETHQAAATDPAAARLVPAVHQSLATLLKAAGRAEAHGPEERACRPEAHVGPGAALMFSVPQAGLPCVSFLRTASTAWSLGAGNPAPRSPR